MTPFTSRDLAAVPLPAITKRDYLTLDELEKIAFEFADQGVSILAAEPDEWHLVVPIKGVQTTFRALRVGGAA